MEFNHKEAYQMKQDGKSWQEIGDHFGCSNEQARNRVLKWRKKTGLRVSKEGSAERERKISEYSDYYEVRGKNDEVTITKEKLRHFKELYCIAKMTINQCSRELEIPRPDLTLIIDAFKITHDDTPFLDEDIKENSVDELVDKAMIQKKKAFFVSFDQKKYADMEKRIKEYDRKDYLYNKALSYFNLDSIEAKPRFLFETVRYDNREAMLDLSDWHIGMQISTYLNTYNYEIAKQRVDQVINEVKHYCSLFNIRTLVIAIMGDMMHGYIHKCDVGAEFDVTVQLKKVCDLLIYLVESLSKWFNIRLCNAYGNHARMESNKSNANDKDNLERIIPYIMEIAFNDNPNVLIQENDISDQIIITNVAGHIIGAAHGDKDTINSGRNFNLLYDNRIEEVHLGHRHTLMSAEEAEIMTYYCRSLCGMDDNSFNIRKKSKAGQTLRIYNEDGLEITREIIFKS